MSESLDITTNELPRTATSVRSGSWYRFLPLLLLGTSTTGWLWMVSLAVDDPGFATEPDYYQKAVDFDRRRELEQESERRGWTIGAVDATIEGATPQVRRGRLGFRLLDREGRPIENLALEAEAFPNARASRVQRVEWTYRGDGRYTTELAAPRAGLWEIRLQSMDAARPWSKTLLVEFGAPEVER